MQIRNATADDFEAVYDFINRLENQVMDRQTQHRIFTQNLSNPNIVYLVAILDNRRVGFLSLHIQNLLHHASPIGEIQEMFVSENARGHGIGRALLAEVKRIASDRKIPQIEVTSSFKRQDAHRFYEREGFGHTHKKFIWKNEAQ